MNLYLKYKGYQNDTTVQDMTKIKTINTIRVTKR